MTFEGTIRLNLDRRGYAEKPGAYVGAIRNRLCTAASIRDLTVDQLMDAIQRGYTFTPAAMAGTTGDTWQGQQVICADLDNDTGEKDKEGHKIMLEPPLTPDEARAIMRGHGINPCFMYFTFSNTDTWPKYRAVLVLDQPLTDAAEAADLTARFAGIFNAARPGCADTKIRDSARLLYGGRAGCVFYASKQATSAATLRALPCPPAAATQTETATAPAPASSAQERPRSAPQRAGDIRDEIEVFDLAAYISSTESSREARKGTKLYFNPCPICGHNDCFQVTGHLWHCWSSNHSGTNAGTVIDFLQRRHNLTLAEAMRMFDYDILHPASVDFAPTDRALDWNDTIGGGAQQAQEGQSMQAAQEAQQMPPTQAAEDQQPPKLGDGISSYILNEMPAEIKTFSSVGAIRTGFDYLDEMSSGGLFPGLYVIGAISGLGKTTLIHQMADQIAASGRDVLFFSLEQSRLEMASKSLARLTAQADHSNALTSLKIRRGVESRPLRDAIRDYTQAVGDHLNIVCPGSTPRQSGYAASGGFRYTVEELCGYVARYIKERGTGPVVILDYLQILNTAQKKATRRDETDYIISTLKIMSGELKVPVLVISSVNRANYLTPVDYESFKESGGIEYTADVVWGLQLSCIKEKLFDKNGFMTEKRERIKQANDENPRKIQLVCLKNRYGRAKWTVDFKFYPQFDLFTEHSGTFAAEIEKAAQEEAQERARAAEEERKARAAKAETKKVLRTLAAFTAQELAKTPDPAPDTDPDFDPLS